eukprot:6010671-Amphidinium_carterae.1
MSCAEETLWELVFEFVFQKALSLLNQTQRNYTIARPSGDLYRSVLDLKSSIADVWLASGRCISPDGEYGDNDWINVFESALEHDQKQARQHELDFYHNTMTSNGWARGRLARLQGAWTMHYMGMYSMHGPFEMEWAGSII